MKIIISPAEKMNVDTDSLPAAGLPVLLEQTRILWEGIRKMSRENKAKGNSRQDGEGRDG